MIRIIENKWQGYGDRHYIEAAGLSTDAKPTNDLVTGSLFMEVDTGKVYAFDEVGGTWNEIGG
jgi:hypothetical protein